MVRSREYPLQGLSHLPEHHSHKLEPGPRLQPTLKHHQRVFIGQSTRPHQGGTLTGHTLLTRPTKARLRQRETRIRHTRPRAVHYQPIADHPSRTHPRGAPVSSHLLYSHRPGPHGRAVSAGHPLQAKLKKTPHLNFLANQRGRRV